MLENEISVDLRVGETTMDVHEEEIIIKNKKVQKIKRNRMPKK